MAVAGCDVRDSGRGLIGDVEAERLDPIRVGGDEICQGFASPRGCDGNVPRADCRLGDGPTEAEIGACDNPDLVPDLVHFFSVQAVRGRVQDLS